MTDDPIDDWAYGLSAATATIRCGDDEHRLEWHGGELGALDHDDLMGDRTLAALGGDQHPCAVIVEAWEAHRDDLRVLLLGSRGPADLIRLPEPPWMPQSRPRRRAGGSSRSGSSWTMTAPNAGVIYSPSGSAGGRAGGPRRAGGSRRVYSMGGGSGGTGRASGGPSDPNDLEGLYSALTLGGPMAHRLAASVIHSWSDRIATDPEAAEAHAGELHAALYGRVASAVRTWLGDPTIDVDVTMLAPGVPPHLERNGPTVEARLPFTWLRDAWSPNLAIVGDIFTLTVRRSAEQAHVAGVTSNLEPVELTLTGVRPRREPNDR